MLVDVFSHERPVWRSNRFKKDRLEYIIRRCIGSRYGGDNFLFGDSALSPSCPTFVVALNINALSSPPVIIRSYDMDDYTKPPVRIWEAALATSATPLLFDPIRINCLGGTFIDGGLGYNNPAELALAETSSLLKTDRERICLVSLGASQRAAIRLPKPIRNATNILRWVLTIDLPRLLKEDPELDTTVANACVNLVKNTEAVHQRISIRRAAEGENGLRYYRFNVERGMERVGMAEFFRLDLVKESTMVYLQDHASHRNIRSCVKDLLNA
jgi:predicted acylesterase/phospholipase RssA